MTENVQSKSAQDYINQYPILRDCIQACKLLQPYTLHGRSLSSDTIIGAGELLDHLEYIPLGEKDWYERIDPLSLIYVLQKPDWYVPNLKEIDRWAPLSQKAQKLIKRVKLFSVSSTQVRYSLLDTTSDTQWVRAIEAVATEDFTFPMSLKVKHHDSSEVIQSNKIIINADDWGVDGTSSQWTPKKVNQWIRNASKIDPLV